MPDLVRRSEEEMRGIELAYPSFHLELLDAETDGIDAGPIA
jgi:hypothetical protein